MHDMKSSNWRPANESKKGKSLFSITLSVIANLTILFCLLGGGMTGVLLFKYYVRSPGKTEVCIVEHQASGMSTLDCLRRN